MCKRIRAADGYVWIDGRLEHRLVMRAHLGGELPPAAHVHHRNLRRDDNALGNLLLTPSDDFHRALHGQIDARRAENVREIEESCLAWAELIREHYASGRIGPLPLYSGQLRLLRRPIVERLGSSRRFIVRPRLA